MMSDYIFGMGIGKLQTVRRSEELQNDAEFKERINQHFAEYGVQTGADSELSIEHTGNGSVVKWSSTISMKLQVQKSAERLANYLQGQIDSGAMTEDVAIGVMTAYCSLSLRNRRLLAGRKVKDVEMLHKILAGLIGSETAINEAAIKTRIEELEHTEEPAPSGDNTNRSPTATGENEGNTDQPDSSDGGGAIKEPSKPGQPEGLAKLTVKAVKENSKWYASGEGRKFVESEYPKLSPEHQKSVGRAFRDLHGKGASKISELTDKIAEYNQQLEENKDLELKEVNKIKDKYKTKKETLQNKIKKFEKEIKDSEKIVKAFESYATLNAVSLEPSDEIASDDQPDVVDDGLPLSKAAGELDLEKADEGALVFPNAGKADETVADGSNDDKELDSELDDEPDVESVL